MVTLLYVGNADLTPMQYGEMMASKNREHHIIWTTACDECGAKIGQPCYWTGRLTTQHGDRLAVIAHETRLAGSRESEG